MKRGGKDGGTKSGCKEEEGKRDRRHGRIERKMEAKRIRKR